MNFTRSQRNVFTFVLLISIVALTSIVAIQRDDIPIASEALAWVDAKSASIRGYTTARLDLIIGTRQVARFGLFKDPRTLIKQLKEFDYSLHLAGCIVGDSNYEYWQAYNRVMVEAGRAQFGERFVAVALGTPPEAVFGR